MGKINWRVIDDEGNPQGYYIQTVPEVDICNHTFSLQGNTYVSAIDGKYGNLLISATESDDTPGVNPSYATNLAPTVHGWDGDNDSAVNFLAERSAEPYFKRFQNPRDNNDVESTYISYDKLWDIYNNNYPQDSYKRFICSTQGYSIWIYDVSIEASHLFYDEDRQQHTFNDLKVTLRMDDGEGQTVSYYSLKSGYEVSWGSAYPVNCGILVTLLMIHEFYPKYWERQENIGTNNCYMYKTGYIATSPEDRSQEPSEPLTLPIMIRVPELWAAQTYAGGQYQYGIVHIDDDWNFKDLIKQWLFVEDNGLCSIPATAFKFGGTGDIYFGDGVYTSEGLVSQQCYISNAATQNSRTGLYDMVKIPYKSERIEGQDAIVYLTMSYTYNEEEEYPEPTADIPTDKPGYNEGGTFTGYDNIGTDKTDGVNEWSLSAMNQNHTCNFSNYIGNEQVIRDLIDRIYSIDRAGKRMLALSDDWDPSSVIFRILEYPFNRTWLFDTGDFIDAAPAQGDKVLTWEYVENLTVAEYERYCAFANGYTVDELKENYPFLSPTTGTIMAAFSKIPGIGVREKVYYKRAAKRWFSIPYGEKVIKRITGDSDDFTDTQYILTLPGGSTIELAPSLLFRSSDTGMPKNECTLKIDGILDIDSGDVLINITADGNMISQTVINIAVERAAGAVNTVNQLRAIKDLFQATANMAINTVIGSAPTATAHYETTKIASGRILKTGENTRQWHMADRTFTKTQAEWAKQPDSTVKSVNDVTYNRQYNTPDSMLSGVRAAFNPNLYSPGSQETVGSTNVSGSVKIIANQLPFLDIYYPIRRIPEQWKEKRGFTAATDAVGEGYNEYGIIDSIICSSSQMLEVEKVMLASILEGGFYYNG